MNRHWLAEGIIGAAVCMNRQHYTVYAWDNNTRVLTLIDRNDVSHVEYVYNPYFMQWEQ